MIKILFFGAIADRLGRRECSLTANSGMTLADVVQAVGCGDDHPLLLAVNQTQVNNMNMSITAGDEIAIMPPFSGG